MEQSGFGSNVSKLARAMAGPKATPKQIESKRRHLHKILNGEVQNPEPATLIEIARALAQPAELLLPPPATRLAMWEAIEDLQVRVAELEARSTGRRPRPANQRSQG